MTLAGPRRVAPGRAPPEAPWGGRELPAALLGAPAPAAGNEWGRGGAARGGPWGRVEPGPAPGGAERGRGNARGSR